MKNKCCTKLIESIFEIIAYRRERANKEVIGNRKLSPNSYGAGADWGMREMCDYIKEDIVEELHDL